MREDGCYQRYVYDLKEKKATALPYRYEDAVNMMVRGFYEDKMIYSYAFEHDDREEGKNVFISNLDGSEEELYLLRNLRFSLQVWMTNMSIWMMVNVRR